MTKQEAYKIVYNDILNRDIGLFLGRFDAKNGKPEFMYGISTLMEFIAYESSEKDYDDFQKIWFENFQKSIIFFFFCSIYALFSRALQLY